MIPVTSIRRQQISDFGRERRSFAWVVMIDNLDNIGSCKSFYYGEQYACVNSSRSIIHLVQAFPCLPLTDRSLKVSTKDIYHMIT